MRSFKVTLVSILLSINTVGVLFTQTAPKLAFSINSGVARSGLPAQMSIRGGLGQHIALNGSAGSAPWRYKQTKDQQIAPDATLKKLSIRGGAAFNLDLRTYTKPGQQGFYGGIGYMKQSVTIESKTKLQSRLTGTNFASEASTIGGFLVGGFFDLLTNNIGGSTIHQTEKAKFNALVIDAGYAHAFEDNSRLEFGIRWTNRNINGIQYNIPTHEAPKAFALNTIAKPKEVSIELRYVIPIL